MATSRVGVHLLHLGTSQSAAPGCSSDDWLSSLSEGSDTVLNHQTVVLVAWHPCHTVIKYLIILSFLLLNNRKSIAYLQWINTQWERKQRTKMRGTMVLVISSYSSHMAGTIVITIVFTLFTHALQKSNLVLLKWCLLCSPDKAWSAVVQPDLELSILCLFLLSAQMIGVHHYVFKMLLRWNFSDMVF